MTFEATANVRQFPDAVEWFTNRFPVTEELLETLGEFAGERAWTIAAVSQLDAVLAAHEILSDAIESGQKLADTMEQLETALSGFSFDGHRLETIVRTNTQSAYNAGRYAQLTDPELVAIRPYYQFDGINDHRQSEICRARDQTTLPALDSWWLSNWPPLHHRCRSTVRSLAAWEAEEVDEENRSAPITFGDAEPRGDFGLAPDVQYPWQPDMDDYPPALQEAFAAKRSDFVRSTMEQEPETP